MAKNQGLTLKKVAEILGVSNATVSNAFNRPDQLSKSRREHILNACAELGYHGPNQAARSLRRGSTGIVALVLSDNLKYMVSDPVASQFIEGVASVIEKQKLNLLLFSGREDNIAKIADFVDGFICYGAPRNSALIDQLADTHKQVVTVDFTIASRASINIDNLAAAESIATQALCTNNDDHDAHIAVLGLRLLNNDMVCRVYDTTQIDAKHSISHRRLSGYLSAINKKGLSLADDRVWNIPESNMQLASIAAKEALSCTPRPNVLLCMSDLIALAAIKEAHHLGLRIPEDVKVVGFDGIDEANRCTPPLTTVHQNSVQKGEQAAQLFVDAKLDNIQLDYTMQFGGSI